jgi:phosphoribosylanthranilate isomerase
MVLLDTAVSGQLGGTGTRFDWGVGRRVAEAMPVMLAGGLTPENVAEAIRTVHPWGVDVSTGVETDGVKDPDKIAAFIREVRATEAMLAQESRTRGE